MCNNQCTSNSNDECTWNLQRFEELGISKATFYRRAKKLKININGGLLSPDEQLRIKKESGALPEDSRPNDLPQTF